MYKFDNIYNQYYAIVKDMIRHKMSRYGEHQAKKMHNEDFTSWFTNKVIVIILKDFENIFINYSIILIYTYFL